MKNSSQFNESIISQIRDLVGIPKKHFLFLYVEPIDRFFNLTQHCKNEEIERHFKAVINSLKMRRSIILPPNSLAEDINCTKDIWTYAVFISSLMHNSANLICRKVIYKDYIDSDFKKWSPFQKATIPGREYQELGGLTMTNYTNVILIRSVFDNKCLTWLYRDIVAFNCVIENTASPNEQTEIGRIIAKFHNLDRKNTELPNKADVDKNLSIKKIEEKPDQKKPYSFNKWLLIHIEKNDLNNICKTLEGYAIADPDIFKTYTRKCLKNPDKWSMVRNKFIENPNVTIANHKITFNGQTKKNALIISDFTALN